MFIQNILISIVCHIMCLIRAGHSAKIISTISPFIIRYKSTARRKNYLKNLKPSGETQSPTTIPEIQSIVKSAILSNQTVKAYGSRHSLSDIICRDGVTIDMSQFKETMQMNPDNSATVSAGVTLRELGTFLHSKGRSLQGGPIFGEITIGGALGTGAHGSALKHETSISAQTIGVKIIDGTGEIRDISDADELPAFRIHLGLLGIILEITISSVPDFKVTNYNYERNEEILTNGEAEKMARYYDFLNLYWFPSSRTVVVSTGTIVSVTTPGNAQANEIPETTDEYNAVVKLGFETFQSTYSYIGLSDAESVTRTTYTQMDANLPPFYTEDGTTFKNPATGYRYLMQDCLCGDKCPWMHYPNNVTYLNNEMALDFRNMSEIIETVKDILSKYKATFQFKGVWLRFTKSSDADMSISYGRETVHFEWDAVRRDNYYESPSHGLAAYQTMLQVFAFKFGGRSHWGKTGFFYHSRSMIQMKLEKSNKASFIATMRKADPNQIFMNDFGKRLLNISDNMNTDPKGRKHCALQDICICRSNLDCAMGQTCGTIPGYPNYQVCKDFKIFTTHLINHFANGFRMG